MLHERLHLDLPQVDFYFYKMKSTCSACSGSNLYSGCDLMTHSLPLIPWNFIDIFQSQGKESKGRFSLAHEHKHKHKHNINISK